MSEWVVANRSTVAKHSILKSIFTNHLAFYVVLEIGQSTVLCAELEQIFSDDFTHLVYSPASVRDCIDAAKIGKKNFCFYLRFDEEGNLRSGAMSMLVEAKIDSANCSTSTSKKIFSTTRLLAPIVCALCHLANDNCIMTGPLSLIGEEEEQQIWAHAYCFSLSGKLRGETTPAFLKRCHQAHCVQCNQRGASFYCENKRCQQVFHLQCAKSAGAEYVQMSGKFFCQKHLQSYSDWHQETIICFPKGTVEYWRCSNWDSISKRDFKEVVDFSRAYQPIQVHWLRQGFYDFVQVVPLATDHWAFDKKYAHKLQYGVVARENIPEGCFFGEYVGKVYYADDPKSRGSDYCAVLHLPPLVAERVPAMVVDSAEFGNEMRFINSVATWVPKRIQKNVEFVTNWVAGLPRIMLTALRPIYRGEELVLDYGKDYFEEDEINK